MFTANDHVCLSFCASATNNTREGHCEFGSSVRLSVRLNLSRVPRYLSTSWRNLQKNWLKYSSCTYSLLERFPRSQVKGQGHKMHFSGKGIPINSQPSVRCPCGGSRSTVWHRSWEVSLNLAHLSPHCLFNAAYKTAILRFALLKLYHCKRSKKMLGIYCNIS